MLLDLLITKDTRRQLFNNDYISIIMSFIPLFVNIISLIYINIKQIISKNPIKL